MQDMYLTSERPKNGGQEILIGQNIQVNLMTNTDTFFSWVLVRRSVTGVSSTIELCSTLLI